MPAPLHRIEPRDLDESTLADPAGTLLGLDFDGTLAHVVDDPTRAFAHPGAVRALERLGRRVGQLAIITGRPVAQALELGGFAGRSGLDCLLVCGQYGAERWSAATGQTTTPDQPEAVRTLARGLPDWLAERGAGHARIEDKGLAVAVHTRGLDPDLLASLDGPLRELAEEHGLHVEPGRQVLELRAPGVDKGTTLTALVHETGSRHVVFVGDDLGDLAAFDAVDALRESGLTGHLVCSASAEQDALVARADLVLDGPDAVALWLGALADGLDARSARGTVSPAPGPTAG